MMANNHTGTGAEYVVQDIEQRGRDELESEAVLVPIEQASIPFYGHTIMAVRLKDGRIAAVLNWLCEGLNLAPNSQVRRIRRKAALKAGLVIVRVETDGGPQAMPALTLQALPGWFYTIDESRVKEAARADIIRYQLEATDVLYHHFSARPAELPAPANLVPEKPVVEPTRPEPHAGRDAWIAYHQQMAEWLAWQDEIERWRGSIEDRLESVEEVTRLIPEIIERLPLQTLSPAHQATTRAMVARLHEVSGISYGSIYGEFNAAFQVGRYTDIPDMRWAEVSGWLTKRIEAAEKRPRR